MSELEDEITETKMLIEFDENYENPRGIKRVEFIVNLKF